MRLFDLGYIIDMAKKRSDMENQDLLDDMEWRMNASEVYAELIQAVTLGNPRYRETELIINTNGESDYDLPDDFLTAIGVDYLSASDQPRQLRQIQSQERNVYTGVGQSEARAFAFINQKLRLYPTPPVNQEYRLVYAPHPIRIECQGPNYKIDVVAPNGEKFMIYALAELALIKEESLQSAKYCEMKADKALAFIEEWAGEQLISHAQRTVVSNDHQYDDHYSDPADYRGSGGR